MPESYKYCCTPYICVCIVGLLLPATRGRRCVECGVLQRATGYSMPVPVVMDGHLVGSVGQKE